MKTKDEALKLADELESYVGRPVCEEAAYELRRLYVEVELLSLENIRLQNLVKDLDDWNDSLRERLSYREAYPANFTRDWEGLTEDERAYFWHRAGTVGWWEVLKMVEAKLREKNA